MNPDFLQFRKLFMSLWLTLSLAGCQGAPSSLDELVSDLESNNFSGAILVRKNGNVVMESGFGNADCDAQVSNTPDTVFAIGSITKMFTDVAIFKLESVGLIDLDDSISTYLEGVPSDKNTITVRQLLSHSSGLATYHEKTDLGDFEYMEKAEAKAEIFSKPLLFSPGSGREYSNSGYTLLAMIIEEVSGQNYTDYLRNELFIPSGMERTGFWGDQFGEIASTQNSVLGCSSPADWNYSWVLVGNGGMVSTIGDLNRWISQLQNRRILNENAMQRSGLARNLDGVFGTAGGSSQHDFNATIEIDGSNEVVVIAISNSDSIRAEEFAVNLLQVATRTEKP